jgi:hypothetical protein
VLDRLETEMLAWLTDHGSYGIVEDGEEHTKIKRLMTHSSLEFVVKNDRLILETILQTSKEVTLTEEVVPKFVGKTCEYDLDGRG